MQPTTGAGDRGSAAVASSIRGLHARSLRDLLCPVTGGSRTFLQLPSIRFTSWLSFRRQRGLVRSRFCLRDYSLSLGPLRRSAKLFEGSLSFPFLVLLCFFELFAHSNEPTWHLFAHVSFLVSVLKKSKDSTSPRGGFARGRRGSTHCVSARHCGRSSGLLLPVDRYRVRRKGGPQGFQMYAALLVSPRTAQQSRCRHQRHSSSCCGLP